MKTESTKVLSASYDPVKDHKIITLLRDGANVQQLCHLFAMDHRTISGKIASITPAAVRGRIKLYSVPEVASHLVRPAYDIEHYIRRMNPAELPKTLSKEYWQALRHKQDYEARAGDLWATEDVVKTYSALVSTIRMQLQLIPEQVNKDVELPQEARLKLRQSIDDMMSELRNQCYVAFGRVPEKLDEYAEEVTERKYGNPRPSDDEAEDDDLDSRFDI